MTSTIEPKPEALTAPDLAAMGNVRHGFFTRQGGVSEGIYAGLNTGLGSHDDRSRVVTNRNAVAAQLGVSTDHLVTPYQVHSADALAIDAPFPDGTERPRCDALVTKTPGLAVAILTADCAPVLFADPSAGVVGAAHAGWRGARDGIVEATIAAMEALGANRPRITAVVGPCITAANYEVGQEFQQQFNCSDPESDSFFVLPTRESRPHFDLPSYVRHRLSRAGVGLEGTTFPCTYADEARFFSFRRTTHRGEPDYGRQISAICLT